MVNHHGRYRHNMYLYRGHLYRRGYRPSPPVTVTVVQPQQLPNGTLVAGVVGAVGLAALIVYLATRK